MIELPLPLEPPHRLELGVSRAARADEVRMIGVRQPIRPGLGFPHDHPLVEDQRGVTRTRESERFRYRLQPLRVGDRMVATRDHAKRNVFTSGRVGQELGRLLGLCPNLEMR